MITKQSIINHFKKENLKQKELESLENYGFSDDGWYFWDKNWSYVFGPYERVAEAVEDLRKYAKQAGVV